MSIDWKPLDYQQLNHLQNMSLDSLVESYKNGFRIGNQNILNMGTGSILKIGTPTCPSGGQIVAGTSKTISMTPSGGTPPYTLNWKIDGTIANSWTNLAYGQTQTFDWGFNESFGSHTYLAEVIDNCPTVSNSDSSSCTINIVAPSTQPPTTQPPTTQPPTTQPPTAQPPGGTTPPPTIQPPAGCTGCDLTVNLCISGQCIPKNYLLYGGIGFIALILLIG